MTDLVQPFAQEPAVHWPEHTGHFEQRLIYDKLVPLLRATPQQRLEALALAVRDLLVTRWLETRRTYKLQNPKMVYYLSMEYLVGRSLVHNVINLRAEPLVRQALERYGLDWLEVALCEPDAGLGNGGLGRLAACFIDSMATENLPAVGYGLYYEYGMFNQQIINGYQIEGPENWQRHPVPWEVLRSEEELTVGLGCTLDMDQGVIRVIADQPQILYGMPHDMPVVGYGNNTINTLRLWSAQTPEYFNFREFASGDFVEAVEHDLISQTVTRVLYPDDSTFMGRGLRFIQEYFLVACSLGDIIRRFLHRGNQWHLLPDKVAIQLNDTHPALAVAELMRILLDQAGLDWDEAWDLTRRTLAYTNHTLLPEALERWAVGYLKAAVPRQLEIIYEINSRFLNQVRGRWPGDQERIRRMSLIENGETDRVRMAHLAIVGSHCTNGVSRIHSELLKRRVVPDLVEMFPERFTSITNGVTPRRWLLEANPHLSKLLTEALGQGWVTNLDELHKLVPLAEDSGFRAAFSRAKNAAKLGFVDWLRRATGISVEPDTIFDSQVKRIHAYKRQLLNVLHIIILYNRLRENPQLAFHPRTFFFAGKAAPSYALAKLIIKLINNVANVLDADPEVRSRLRVVFVPNYSVSVAQVLIPASDISEQISTAGYEASGTGNMKFMMNGALTVGTRDGANIEIAEEVGEENLFLFGLSAEQVEQTRGWYNPWWHYEHEPETRQALDLIFSNHFSPTEPGIFEPIRQYLLTRGDYRWDYYMHLADLQAYTHVQEEVGCLYCDRDQWLRKSILNVACSGKFSSDRAIREYNEKIWKTTPCPIDKTMP